METTDFLAGCIEEDGDRDAVGLEMPLGVVIGFDVDDVAEFLQPGAQVVRRESRFIGAQDDEQGQASCRGVAQRRVLDDGRQPDWRCRGRRRGARAGGLAQRRGPMDEPGAGKRRDNINE